MKNLPARKTWACGAVSLGTSVDWLYSSSSKVGFITIIFYYHETQLLVNLKIKNFINFELKNT